ncbi:hypothetical protein [Arcobacter sp. FWKO B]|uniref:hypothetical protein n=1 Tax=Arcobacter sp. FWKO B TaxID=2593672 RepID=UPI0018A69E47|nr:hypothetical protein [Arcobacter sp. FWKO B]QOG12744.1 hypothetical protein FWKOB_08580 [Arcobacter sp. FWKO B]
MSGDSEVKIPLSVFEWIESHTLGAKVLLKSWENINTQIKNENKNIHITELETLEYIYKLKHKVLKQLLSSQSQDEIDQLEKTYRILDQQYNSILDARIS